MPQTRDGFIDELSDEKSSEPPGGFGNPPVIKATSPAAGTNPAVRISQWHDWRWQMRNRIRTVEQLADYMPLGSSGNDLQRVMDRYPMSITPYYASLIVTPDASDPIYRQSIPDIREMFDLPCLSADPLEEHDDMPVPGLIHRYRDRVLLITTTQCSTYCRHCTRKRIAGMRESSISNGRLERVVDYLKNHGEIRDVIISGGDPLTLSDAALDRILSAVRSVRTVEVIRIGTRVPVVLPMRINPNLVNILSRYHPVWINTHFNHPAELTAEAGRACALLADAGIPLGNQSVLLRGVNDDVHTIEQLCRALVRSRVRPYYIYQCDLVKGVEHLRTSLRKGIEIMEYLRGRVSGIAIPTYVVDAPHGGGKIPILPNYIVSMSPTHTVLRNYEGLLVNYPEPGVTTDPKSSCVESAPGVWDLAGGQAEFIAPARSHRMLRRNENAAEDTNHGSRGFLFES